MAYEHESGIDAAYDRTPDAPSTRTDLVFVEDRFIQGAELNELQGLTGRRIQAIGDLVAGNGNRESDAEIKVAFDIDPEDPNAIPTTASIILQAGRIYIDGHVLSVAAAQFDDVPISGDVIVGVRQVVTRIGHEEDPSLVGLHPGTDAEGEPGAYRTNRSLEWGLLNDGGEGQFIQVYKLLDGTVVDQTAPPALDGILATAAIYDRARGSYIVAGCEVSALGDDGNDRQILSVGAGAANIQGWRRTRETAFTLFQTQDPDLELVSAEAKTFTDGGSGTAVLTVARPPIANVVSAVVTMQISENVTRGPVPNGLDELQEASIVEIISVTQAATTFDPATYSLSGDNISWAPAGDEPAAGSTYVVTYRYFKQVAPDAFDATTITLSGGVTDETALLTYNSKIPRKDVLVFDIDGTPSIVKGQSARKGALPPKPPEGYLKIAEIHNTWDGAPEIVNNGTRVPTYDELWGYLRLTVKLADQLNRTLMEQSVPDAAAISADGIFTDDFWSDFYRDEGVVQTAAANQGVLQLPVYEQFVETINTLVILDYTEEVIISQPLATGSMKVNPYANYNPMPGLLALNPNNDFWTETETQWTSSITRQFTAAPGQSPGRTTITEEVRQTTRAAEFLRQIDIDFSIEGFAPNEQLEKLLFAGRDVTPAGPLVAGANGDVQGTFQIPARVPTGTHAIRAEGAAGGFAEASFVGAGEITVEVMRRVNLVTRAAPPPVVNVINNIVRVTNVNNVSNNRGPGEGNGREGGMNGDPLAFTFVPPVDCMMLGFDVEIAEVGDPANGLVCQLARTLNGYPTNEVLATTFIPMVGVQPGDKVSPRWDAPHYLSASEKYCVVIMTDDADHALKIATLGEVVPESQQLVSSQPYTNGDLFSGSNRTTWVAHPKSDLKIDIVAAKFSPVEKTVDLYQGDIEAITDLVVRGTVELQSDQTRFRYELVRANGDVIPLASGQSIEFDEYVSETITLRAVLNGNEYLSPVLWPGTTIIGGQVQEQADYVSKNFKIEGPVGLRALFDRWQPAGATVTIFVDSNGDENWQPLVQESARALGGGWTEPKLNLAGFSAPNGGRVKVTLNGTPAARPSIARLRAYGY
ncbi:hypothetical protein FIU93_28140 [Labrenzia sp. THAF35]|uniref:DUF4815 domain-containing protein n=1 Tax=Labrenzia sp. THAF35 TaxID=2587854 RepID=UPI0012682C66|nr:DUF4815 domain-containing protein [Labrenzia sp. THAF35]QFT70687.1 hypothetical protein FIU93_28140 [Labrenzia sp. THAF35]